MIESNEVSIKSIHYPLLQSIQLQDSDVIKADDSSKLKLDVSMITVGLVTFVGDAARGILVIYFLIFKEYK